MATQDNNTAPAREALAAWNKLHDERESLNGNLDFCNDSVYHQPEGRLPAETVRELATAAVLLQQANVLIDKAHERQSRRPALPDTVTIDGKAFKTDALLRAIDEVMQGPKPKGSELKGETVTIDGKEYPCDLALRALDIVFAPESVSKVERATARARMEAFERQYRDLSPKECANELRRDLWDVSENIAADPTEDEFTVSHTWTDKGLRYMVARQRFLDSLLSDD